MTPADRLIVALDVPAPDAGILFSQLHRELGVTQFKVGAATLIEWSGRTLIENMQRDGARIMLDLKVYDVDTTVARVVREAHAMGVEMLTVHVRSVIAAIGAIRELARPTILAVDALTSDGPGGGQSSGPFGLADGIVCHPSSARYYREIHGGKLIVCPGIRRPDREERLDESTLLWVTGDAPDDHIRPISPREAIRNGADMIIVGRPITGAADPVAVAREIIEEIADAG